MPIKPKLTREQIDDLCATYIAGVKQVDLAKQFSISQGVVSKYLRMNKVKTRIGGGKRMARREFCKRGHKLADPNLYYRKVKGVEKKVRVCKTCVDAQNKNYYDTVRKYRITKAVK